MGLNKQNKKVFEDIKASASKALAEVTKDIIEDTYDKIAQDSENIYYTNAYRTSHRVGLGEIDNFYHDRTYRKAPRVMVEELQYYDEELEDANHLARQRIQKAYEDFKAGRFYPVYITNNVGHAFSVENKYGIYFDAEMLTENALRSGEVAKEFNRAINKRLNKKAK